MHWESKAILTIALLGTICFGIGAQAPGPSGGGGRGASGGRGRGGGGRGTPVVPEPPGYQHITVQSSIDKTDQDSVLVVPIHVSEPRTLVVYLHGWSVTDTDRRPDAEAEAESRGWFLLIPNIRGPYDHPDGCGSHLMQQDVLDGIDWMKQKYSVDGKHVYLLGLSGGAFISMAMAALYPQTFAAVSEWSGIVDLSTWYTDEHSTDRYAQGMEKCFGGSPTQSAALKAAYLDRSPISHLKPGLGVPLDLNAQKEDPIVSNQNSLRAFRALEPEMLSAEEAAKMARGNPPPPPAYIRMDPSTGRPIYLRREGHDVRITIREGGHEMFAKPAFEWFDQYQRRQ
jgi:pimeloyl-ACP methyl ester carboxylesterase